jgi:hypothetical protein
MTDKNDQGQKSVLDWQIANRRAKSYILDLAYNAMNANAPLTSADNGGNAMHRMGSHI